MSRKIKRIFNEAKPYKEQCVSSNTIYYIWKLKHMENVPFITSNVRRCDSLDPRLDKAEVFSLGGYSDRIRLVVDWISEWQIENFYPKMI